MADYILSDELREAVHVAEITMRPLLLKGEPGTGKTLLANYVAEARKLPLFRWHVKSTSLAKEGLYFYDAVARLNDSRFPEEEAMLRVRDVKNYIRLGALGEAFADPKKSVVLIDEIDKADIEFPNDLLLELDKMEFFIPETKEMITAKERPLIIITSNNEKELPDAFLRRCIFHYIEFPKREAMKEIILAHYPRINTELMEKALAMFYTIRKIESLRKKPSTSELLDWIQVLLHTGETLSSDQIPFAGTLFKSEEDYRVHLN
ncbi:MoxR family ATPase [Leptospira ognonensis]|uniref:MoxR family ATPase n=1 Tax=Leptospira ognonensis TaxID=2484945 RepID=A0A4V3JQZ1_9LEPT|nr:MoxR family ATPase [Leptospira ognonensis]TGL57476.1 MoxR family ATPase [Leptospira ognonensis]